MKKIYFYIVFTLIVLFTLDVYALEINEKITDELILQQLESVDISEIQELVDDINKNASNKIPSINVKDTILSLIKGQTEFSLKDIFNTTISILFREILTNSKLLAELIFISLMCAMLNNLTNSFGESKIGEIAFYTCYLVVIGITVKSFMLAVTVGQDAIESMVNAMQALIPILFSLLIAVGSITTSAIFKPVIVASIGITSTIIKDLIFPLVFLTTILAIINNLTSKIQITKLASLLKQICLAILGLILTIFLGVISIQGVIASSTDGITLRTARFAMDNFVPIVGGFMAEAIDAVLGCSLLLKNAIGIIGLIIILIMVSFPILKILSLIIIYKLAAALIEPISDNKIVNCLNDISGSLVIVFAAVISVAIMFFMAITAVIGAGNITAMLR